MSLLYAETPSYLPQPEKKRGPESIPDEIPLEPKRERRPGYLGDFKLLKLLSRGGSGEVYLAKSTQGKPVAIKVLASNAARDQDRLLRFYTEARHLMMLEHPNLVRAKEVAEDDGKHYIVMEYVNGESLASRIMTHGRIRETDALRIAISVAQGLQAAHSQNIIHRDVSPKNLMLLKSGGVKLVDFEFSKDSEMDLDLTMDGMGLGTPDFMCPEQFRDAKNVDARSDIYSLGATLYVMVAGRLPFPGDTFTDKWLAKARNHYLPPNTFNKKLSPAILELIDRALDADPENRPRSADEFVALAECCLSKPDQKLPEPICNGEPEVRWTAVFISESGRSKRLTATTQGVVDLIRTKQLGPDTRIALEGTDLFRKPSEIPQFKRLYRSPFLKVAIGFVRQNARNGVKYLSVGMGRLLARAATKLGA